MELIVPTAAPLRFKHATGALTDHSRSLIDNPLNALDAPVHVFSKLVNPKPNDQSYDDLVDHCCNAWNKLTDQPWRIMSLGLRQWAHGF